MTLTFDLLTPKFIGPILDSWGDCMCSFMRIGVKWKQLWALNHFTLPHVYPYRQMGWFQYTPYMWTSRQEDKFSSFFRSSPDLKYPPEFSWLLHVPPVFSWLLHVHTILHYRTSTRTDRWGDSSIPHTCEPPDRRINSPVFLGHLPISNILPNSPDFYMFLPYSPDFYMFTSQMCNLHHVH